MFAYSNEKFNSVSNATLSRLAFARFNSSTIRRDIFRKNGTLADAAVATLLCMGVQHPQASGIGGGFVALYYR